MQQTPSFPWRLLRDIDGKDLIEYHEGNIPIIITAPHGGKLEIGECITCGYCQPVPVRKHGNHEEDFWTVELSYAIRAACEKFCLSEGRILRGNSGAPMRPFQIIARAHRKYCDLNRAPEKSYENPNVAHYYNRFHQGVRQFILQAQKLSPTGHVLLIDLHGQSYMKGHVLRGTQDGRTVTRMLKNMGLDALIGPSSLLGYLHTHGAPVSPCTAPATRPNDPERPEEHKNFNGGHTVGHHGSHRDDGVDAIQIEVGYDFRKDNDARHKFGDMLAAAIVEFSNTYQLSQKQPKPAQQS